MSISRRYTQDNNTFYYPHEKYFSGDPTPELPGWDNNSNPGDGDQAIPVHLFPKHVMELHMDQVGGLFRTYFSSKCTVLYKIRNIII